MTINKSRGNMYPDTDTWNGMYGKCPYQCSYCYNRKYWKTWGKMRLNERALKENLGSGNFYFVGSSCDMFAKEIPKKWILEVLEHCRNYTNKYLFQTKNPVRFHEGDISIALPIDVILGTTIETNRTDLIKSKAPLPEERIKYMELLNYSKMVSIEPIIDFDLDIMVKWIKRIRPKFVYMGADSKNSGLIEPSKEKVESLIKELSKFTEVRIKKNLGRLMR